MALIDTIAVEAFTDAQNIEDNTDWQISANSPIVSRRLADEKWLQLGSSFPIRAINRDFPTGTEQYEAELHFLLNFDAGVVGSLAGTDIAWVGNSSAASSSTERAGIGFTAPSAGTTGTPVLESRVTSTSHGGRDNFGEAHPISANSTFHVVIRTRAESAINASDGRFEIFVNGELLKKGEAVDWDSSTPSRFPIASVYFNTASLNKTYIRDVFVYDAWTSADDVMPAVGHLSVASVDTVTAGTYTNEGGAVDAETALTDGDDTTYLKSAGLADELNVSFTVDPAIASKAVEAVIVQSKIGRENAAFNTAEIELKNAAGTTSLGTETQALSAVAPSRQIVSKQIEPSSAINANDFSVAIRNGS